MFNLNYYQNTYDTTPDYKQKVVVVDVKPKKQAISKVIWITDDSIPMNVLVSLVKMKSPEIIISKLDYK